MNNENKIKYAGKLLDLHEKLFGFKASAKLVNVWSSGDLLRYGGKSMPSGYVIKGHDQGTYQLSVTVPNWEILTGLGNLDEAVSGPNGEWKFSKYYLPVFECGEGIYIVGRVDEENCPVGIYMEGTFSNKEDGFRDGVKIIENSLEHFLSKLIDEEEPDFKIEVENEIWSQMEEAM
jgi:hypothetical protein